MRRIVVGEFVSLDGVMEDPGGAEKFEHGGWTIPYWNDDIAAYKASELFASDGLLLGRVTYEGFAAAWPKMKDDFADHMNNVAKYVVSSTLDTADWNNSTVITDDLVEAMTNLKQQPGKDILLTGGGSATLVQALMRHDLVDELRLEVYPVVLGSGKRLFADSGRLNLDLVDTQPTSSGVILLTYRPAGQN